MGVNNIYQQYQSYADDTGWQTNVFAKNHFFAEQQQVNLQHKIQVNNLDSDVILSRFQGRGSGMYTSQVNDFNHNFSLFIMLAGKNTFTLSNYQSVTVLPEQIWLTRGHWENVTEHISTTNDCLDAIHLDFSLERLRRWHDEGVLSSQLYSTEKTEHNCVKQLANSLTAIRPFAQQVMLQTYGSDSISQLLLESATLTLTAKILKLFSNDKPQQKHRKQIDEVIDIIHAEYCAPLTIASLAKRVGINEFHLKQYFKLQTNETIVQYIRHLRLHQAHDMLVFQNKTVQEAMFFVGYKHIGHFNEIFKRQFGITPRQAKYII